MDDLKPRNAALFGLLLATIANPKNLPLGASAGVTLADAGMDTPVTLLACAVFTAVGSVGMFGVAMVRLVGVGRPAMGRLRDWLGEHSAAITIPLFLVLGTQLVVASAQAIGPNP